MAHDHEERWAVADDDVATPTVQRDGRVWRIRSWEAARQVLRARTESTQAGFTSEAIPQNFFRHRPILIADGPEHDAQRKKVSRFFAPKVVMSSYGDHMRQTAKRRLDVAQQDGAFSLDDLALQYSVEVARRAVGLESSSIRGMSKRLERFFTQPPFDITKPGLGRTRRQWARAAFNGIRPITMFFFADVWPAVRHAKKHPAQNVITHLITEGYGLRDILVECVTYGTAGMVTTREFITMAAWHLLNDESLRTRYLASSEHERYVVLEEILRLEPVVGHLYRRVQSPFVINVDETAFALEPGDLVDICVRQTNTDPAVVDDHGSDEGDPMRLCPSRDLPAGHSRSGLSFSDGAHSCPGQWLAIAETEVLLTDLLSRNPVLVKAPALGWDHLVTGYTLRGMSVAFPKVPDGDAVHRR